ncbi:MAG: hypothetical protein WC551_02240 [Patescibacteria group bacterium]
MEITAKKSKIVWGILIGILCLVILLSVFQLGSSIGFRKARFACQWGERYGAMIGMPLHAPGQGQGWGPGPMAEWPQRGVPDAHGANGSVISVSGNGLVVKGINGIEQMILVSSSTKIRKGNLDVMISDIAPEDRVVIMGGPDESGEIQAGFIRVFDHKLMP